MSIVDSKDADVNECCKVDSNLREEPSGKENLILRRCQVCNRRHFELSMPAFHLGVAGKPL